jgi:hypothetical protein
MHGNLLFDICLLIASQIFDNIELSDAGTSPPRRLRLLGRLPGGRSLQ